MDLLSDSEDIGPYSMLLLKLSVYFDKFWGLFWGKLQQMSHFLTHSTNDSFLLLFIKNNSKMNIRVQFKKIYEFVLFVLLFEKCFKQTRLKMMQLKEKRI